MGSGIAANMLAAKLGLEMYKKSMRASREALEKKKKLIESIQIDLGVNMVTGTMIRDRVAYEMTHKNFEKAVELLSTMKSGDRTRN